MRANVYIDGFNFYYGAVKRTAYKWLDFRLLAEAAFPDLEIHRIRYFTARLKPLSGQADAEAKMVRQNTYLRALQTIPGVSIHFGAFLAKTKYLPKHPVVAGSVELVRVEVVEEKGSDVNLASFLLLDAFKNEYDAAVVVTNDSDLLEPVRMVKEELGKRVVVLDPQRAGNATSNTFRRLAHHYVKVSGPLLAECQFPDILTDANGAIRKPDGW